MQWTQPIGLRQKK